MQSAFANGCSASPTSAGSLSSYDNDSIFSDWTFNDNKACEVALANHLECADRFARTAACVGNKTPEEVQSYYQQLEEDLRRIELGLTPVPEYDDFLMSSCDMELLVPPVPSPPMSLQCSPQCSMEPIDPLLPVSMLIPEPMGPPPPQKPKKSSKQSSPKKAKVPAVASGQAEKRKGVPWTEEEHKLFLLGLAKFGKGDWRNIARNYVTTRTPTQVASHAQKYFIRLNSQNKKEKRRASIHDITSATVDGMEYTAVGLDQDAC